MAANSSGASKEIPVYLPGGKGVVFSTEHISPFDDIRHITEDGRSLSVIVNTVETPQYGNAAGNNQGVSVSGGNPTGNSAIVKNTYTVLRDKLATIEQVVVEKEKDTGATWRDSSMLLCFLFDSRQYREAERLYKKLLTSKTCYNSNLGSSTADVVLPEWAMALLRWQDFPFIEYREEGEYSGVTGVNPATIAKVSVKHYIYDLLSGMLMLEYTYTFQGVVAATEVEPDFVIDKPRKFESYVHAKYKKLELIFGKPVKAQFRDGVNYWFALTEVDSIEYTPVTSRLTQRQSVRRENTPFTPPDQLTGEYPDDYSPVILTTTDTQLIVDSVPRLARRDLTDLRARYGRFSAGDLAMKLTARDAGSPTTSAQVNYVVSGVNDHKSFVVAEQLIHQYGDGSLYGRAELISMTSEIVGEVQSSVDVIAPRIAVDLDMSLSKVQRVILLYQVRFNRSDTDVLSGYIKKITEILDLYDTKLTEFLDLYACQRNVARGVVTACWDKYKSVTHQTAVSKWFENLDEQKAVKLVDTSTAYKLYTKYVYYRGKIEEFAARVSEETKNVRLRSKRSVGFSVFNTSEICHIGNKISIDTRRDNIPEGFISSVSVTIPNGGFPTMSIDYEYDPEDVP